jgi:threonine dehydratase
MNQIPRAVDIEAVEERIKPFIHRTPVFTSSIINEISGCKVYFKCENLQKIGAFKMRGAANAVALLTDDEKKQGVATHSSGNHAQALAKAAQMQGIKAYIVMPESAPQSKVEGVIRYGGEVIFCAPTLAARESTLQEVQARTGALFIPPYDDYRIIAGQATAAKELIEDTDPLHTIIAPVGGGGLLAGTALSAHYFSPKTKVLGAEPEGADDAYRSFTTRTYIPQTNPQTISDCLLTSLGHKNFPIILEHVSEICTVSDEETIAAMRLIWTHMKIIVEPGSAVALAVLLKHKANYQAQRIGIILSGGNVDLNNLPF